MSAYTGLAFIAYWGIVLFGYDTGIAGGVVSSSYFQGAFGVAKGDVDDVSSNVVSVLQAGAFFGALGSAPISARIGRRYTIMLFTIFFAIGAVSPFFLFLWRQNNLKVLNKLVDLDYSRWWFSWSWLHLRWSCCQRSRHRWHLSRISRLRFRMLP
jgi:MFS family permease